MPDSFYLKFQPESIPIPSGNTALLIQYCSKSEIDVNEFAQIISTNPLLVVQILKVSNSALYGFSQEIKSIQHAITCMGLNSMRSLVLCFSVREALGHVDIEGFDCSSYWVDSVRRGISAKLIAEKVGGPADEAFTAGLLADIGFIVLFILEPHKADRSPLLRANNPEPRYAMEKSLFGITHDDVGAQLLELWQLPDCYSNAIKDHHNFKDEEERNILSDILMLSDLCNATYTSHNKTEALCELEKSANKLFKLSKESVEEILAEIPKKVAETASSFDVKFTSQIDFEQIMTQASQRLLEDNISYHELTVKLQQTLKQRDLYAAKLDQELDIAREIQQSLQPVTSDYKHIAAFNIPALKLSGDFFDYFVRDNGFECFCLGDVSGKGTSASLLMAKTISLFRCLSSVETSLASVVKLINSALWETSVRGMFVTFTAGWFDTKNQQLYLINAGHLATIIIEKDGIVQLPSQCPPLGIIEEIDFKELSVTFDNGRLYLYSDGLTEYRTENGEELGVKGLLRWLLRSKKLSVSQQLSWIKETLAEQAIKPNDDLTLMIIDSQR